MASLISSYLGSSGGENWTRLGTDFFCKNNLGVTGWPFAFPSLQPGVFSTTGLLISCAPRAGPIAILRDSFHDIDSESGDSLQKAFDKRLCIFSYTGQLLASFPVPYDNILHIQWDINDHIACIHQDGAISIYNVHGHCMLTYNFQDCTEICDVSSFNYGVVARKSGTNQILFVSFVTGLTTVYPVLPHTAICVKVKTFDLFTLDLDAPAPQILVSTPDKRLLQQSPDNISTVATFPDSVVSIAVSICGTYTAVYEASGRIHLLSPDYSRILWTFSRDLSSPPINFFVVTNELFFQVNTCESIVNAIPDSTVPTIFCSWSAAGGRTIALLIQGDSFASYQYPHSIIASCDFDGIRVITESTCDLIYQVPKSIVQIFYPGYSKVLQSNNITTRDLQQIEPGLLLFYAYQKYNASKGELYDKNNIITGQHPNPLMETEAIFAFLKKENTLVAALSQLMQCCGVHCNTNLMILQVIAFGRLHIDVEENIDSGSFVETCSFLRVCEQLMHYGIPLTPMMIRKIDLQILVQRLVQQEEFQLAFKIAQHLRLSIEHIVESYCVKLIVNASSNTRDDVLLQQIYEKMSLCPGLSYANITQVAVKHMRGKLAISLTRNEPKPSSEVSLLLNFEQWQQAIAAANRSLDYELAVMTLKTCEKHMSPHDFDTTVAEYPFAQNAYLAFCAENCLYDRVKDFYTHNNQVYNTAVSLVHDAYVQEDIHDRMIRLETAKAIGESEITYAHVIEAAIELVGSQERFQQDYNEPFVDMSARETVEAQLLMKQEMKAQRLKTLIKIPDMLFEYIEVFTQSSLQHFDALYKRATSNRKGPAIGYEPFVVACYQAHNNVEAGKYVALLSEITDQQEWYCTLEMWHRAIDVAVKAKDVNALELIKGRCKKSDVHHSVDEAIASLH